MTQAVLDLVGTGRNDPVMVIAHDAVNRALLARCANLADDPNAISQRTGCWNRIQVDPGAWNAVVVDALPGQGPWP